MRLTQHAPGHVMFGRTIRTKAPELPTSLPVQNKFEKLCVNDTTAKLKRNQNTKDSATYSSSRKQCFTKGYQSNKLSTPHHPEPFTVVHKKDNMETVKETNNQYNNLAKCQHNNQHNNLAMSLCEEGYQAFNEVYNIIQNFTFMKRRVFEVAGKLFK